MPNLPSSLAVVRVAVASLLRSPGHTGRLYGAEDIAGAVNDACAIDGDVGVDVKMLLCAFANDTADEYALSYAE